MLVNPTILKFKTPRHIPPEHKAAGSSPAGRTRV